MWKFSFPTDWISERTNKTEMLNRFVFYFNFQTNEFYEIVKLN